MKKQLHNLSIFGTSSDAGKSTLTFVLGRIIQEHGYSVVPFKAQNVSNNSKVCDDGSEIAIAQYFQAEVLGVDTSYHLNPVLLKSGRGNSASLIVEGKVCEDKDVRAYYKDLDTLKPSVINCFENLDKKFDVLVCEGAGSPVELNLMDKDLSNIFVATQFNTKIVLVADIERGGVFASIYGCYHLLPKELQKNVIGVIVNKFRGDMSLFDKGIKIIEEEFKIPVLGVLPYVPFNLGFEDSQSLMNYQQDSSQAKIKVGVISYPYMSNYNDIEPLIADSELDVEFVKSNINLEAFDLIILPGSKLVIKDLIWLKELGLFKQLLKTKKEIYGICGGFEMMCKTIFDSNAVENKEVNKIEGLGFINDEVIFQEEKILKKGKYELFGLILEGFEIHHGVTKSGNTSYFTKEKKGSFLHGVFDDDNFRLKIFKNINKDYQGFSYKEYKTKTIDSFVSNMKEHLDIKRFIKGLQ